MSDSGHFCWYDMNTNDVDSAKAFYGAVAGWSTVPHNEDYTMLAHTGGPFGGLSKLAEQAKSMGAPPHLLAWVTVDDVDIKAAWVEQTGGQVLTPPHDMPNIGRMAVIADPQGAVIGLFRSAHPEPAKIPEEHPLGAVGWHELATSDHAAALEWYGQLFGWKLRMEMDMGEGKMYRMFGFKEMPWAYGGMFDKPPEMPTSTWMYYIKVVDIDAAIATARELGGTLMNGPMEVPGGDRVAQLVDNQGCAFALLGK
jgi:uncharacterized protein